MTRYFSLSATWDSYRVMDPVGTASHLHHPNGSSPRDCKWLGYVAHWESAPSPLRLSIASVAWCEALQERFAVASVELPVVNYPWVTSFTCMHNTKVQKKSVFYLKLRQFIITHKHNNNKMYMDMADSL